MAAPLSPTERAAAVALALVVVGMARHYGASIAPDDIRGLVSKALGGAESLAHLAIICTLVRATGPVLLAAAWCAWEAAQVVACSVWYIMEPWHVPNGAAMCSARAGYDFGILGAAVAASVTFAIYRWGRR